MEDKTRVGKPSTVRIDKNIDKIHDFVRPDSRLTVSMIGEQLYLNHTTIHRVLTNELGMRKIYSENDSKNPFAGTKKPQKKTLL